MPPFGRLLAARIAGDAVNYVTPTATLGTNRADNNSWPWHWTSGGQTSLV